MTSEFILTFPLICFILSIFCSGACVRACVHVTPFMGGETSWRGKKLWQCCVMNVIQVKFVYKE